MGGAAAMRTLLSGPFPWLISAATLALTVAFFWIAGSAVVVDQTGGVQTAVVINSGGTEQKLRRLWSGYFYAIPRVEGTIEVRCTNGGRKQMGYVTGLTHTTVRVVGNRPCERIVDAN